MAEDKKPAAKETRSAAQIKADKKAIAAHWAQFVGWYQSNYGGGSIPPAALKKQYMDGYLKGQSWDNTRAALWIRNNDKNYEKTTQYKSQLLAFRDLYKAANVPMDRDAQKRAETYARSKPVSADVQKADLAKYFAKYVMTSPSFTAKNPGFDAWRKNPSNRNAGNGDIIAALDEYIDVQNRFLDSWRKTGLSGEIPKDIFNKALTEDWTPDESDSRWISALRNSSAYTSSQSYADRVTEFNEGWAGAMPDGTPPPAGMVEKFARGEKSWNDFLSTTVKDSPEFNAAYPGYKTWEAAQIKKGGEANMPGQIDIYDYFEAKTSYQDEWESLYEDGQPINQKILDEAMAGNWSLTKFRNTIKKLPVFASTPNAKKKAQEFDAYYKGLFGESAPKNSSLANKYAAGEFTDPSALWDDIKKTGLFQSQYQNWDSFSAAQSAAGVNVLDDPTAYKEYQAEFNKAFSDIGMAVPVGMDKQIFASGMTSREIVSNADAYSANKDSYSWQTGQQADMGTAIGAGDKVAGGDLRKRMAAALAQHQEYAGSKFKQFNTDVRTGAKKI